MNGHSYSPIVFALISYGIAALIAVMVTFIVRLIAFLVREKKPQADEAAAKPKAG
jgi:tryptophan-rich sensory protein